MSQDDDDLADFGARLRAQLAPVTPAPARDAAVRARAHAELRRASAPPAVVRARRHVVRVLETSTALAAGASYVLWTIAQLYRP
jgi:hypothetical protein